MDKDAVCCASSLAPPQNIALPEVPRKSFKRGQSLRAGDLFRRSRRRAKVAVGDEAGTCGVVFRPFAPGIEIAFSFLARFNLVALALRCDRDLTLQIRPIEFDVGGLQSIKHRLRWLPITVVLADR